MSLEEDGGCVPNGRSFSVLDINVTSVEYNRSLDISLPDAARIKKLFDTVSRLPDTEDPDAIDADIPMVSSGRLVLRGCI
jgi:hypothetical protein